jgi:hypothetical protein
MAMAGIWGEDKPAACGEPFRAPHGSASRSVCWRGPENAGTSRTPFDRDMLSVLPDGSLGAERSRRRPGTLHVVRWVLRSPAALARWRRCSAGEWLIGSRDLGRAEASAGCDCLKMLVRETVSVTAELAGQPPLADVFALGNGGLVDQARVAQECLALCGAWARVRR